MAITIQSKDLALEAFLRTTPNDKYYDDPTTVGFQLAFIFSGEDSPLFNESDRGESAIAYMNAIGEVEKADMLRRFKQRIQDIQQLTPYFFQKLEGLKNIHETNWKAGYDHDRTLKISTLESIDMRVSAAVNDYMEAVYDIVQGREMLPANLQEFKLFIIVAEIRRFRSLSGAVKPASDKVVDSLGDFGTNLKDINESISTHVYEFVNCRFDFAESDSFIDGIENGAPKEANNHFKIKVGALVQHHKLGFLDLFNPQSVTGHPSSLKAPSQSKPSTNLINQFKRFVESSKSTGLEQSKRIADEFLQANDPAYIASRLANQQILTRIDSAFKKFLFGAESLLDKANIEKNLADILAGKGPNTHSIDKTSIIDVTKPTSANRDSLGITSLPPGSDFDRPSLSDVESAKKSDQDKQDLGSADEVKQSDFDRQDLGTLDEGQLSAATLASNVPGFSDAPFTSLLYAFLRQDLGTLKV